MSQPQNRIEPMQQPSGGNGGKKTLAGVVGIAVAVALGVSIPEDESGRKVTASVNPVTQQLQVRHVSGPQYLKVYFDIVGVATACDGLTRDPQGRPLRAGQTFTEAQCATMLEMALVAHAERVMACSPGLAISGNPATELKRRGPRFAAVSLAYNVGTGAYCASTARRMFNAGEYTSGCNALTAFNRGTFPRPQSGLVCTRKKDGRYSCIIRGLQLRRERERNVCLKGL